MTGPEAWDVGSLFSGIGGLDRGLERAGMTVRWQSEIDPYASRVLRRHWPAVPNLGDCTLIDWSTVERVDLICGGFPCQPVSQAGLKQAQLDARWLWPEFARCIRAMGPRVVLVENVPGLLVRGIDEVLGDLADLGYDAEWERIPAAAVGAPHLRHRIWIVGIERRPAVADPEVVTIGPGLRAGGAGRIGGRRPRDGGGAHDVADADRAGLVERWGPGPAAPQHASAQRGGEAVADAQGLGEREPSDAPHPVAGARHPWPVTGGGGDGGRAGPMADPDGGRRGGVGEPEPERIGRPRGRVFDRRGPLRELLDAAGGDQWAVEPDVGRVADGVPARVDRLRCLGNAVVPQVAEFIGRAIIAAG